MTCTSCRNRPAGSSPWKRARSPRTRSLLARGSRISEDTVKTHISRILSKLGAADRTQAAIIGLQRKLVPLDTALDWLSPTQGQ